MKRARRWLTAFVLVFLLAAVPCLAEVADYTDQFWYLDEANVLSEATEGEIFYANQRMYTAAGAEVVIVAIDSTGNMSMEDYAYTLFEKWGIGGDNMRGFLLVMAIDDDDYYAMPGTMLEPYFSGSAVGELLDEYLEPDFAKKDYDRGARLFFEAVYDRIADKLNLDLSAQDGVKDYQSYLTSSASATSEADRAYTSQVGGYDAAPAVHRQHSSISAGSILLVIILLIVLYNAIRRAVRRNVGAVRRSIFGPRVVVRPPIVPPIRPRRSPPPIAPRPNPGPRRDAGPFGGASRPAGGFGGSSRHSGSFGGSHSSGAGRSSVSRSGFGGASRGSISRSSGFTRGGGAGRGRR